MDSLSLSICCITYNHEKFINETIKGFLSQKTSFPIEIIIGNDNSVDQTGYIIERYRRFDPRIIYLNNNSNIGMCKNLIQVLEKARGKYIALCEGDDYWTDPNKLQKQVDFLESHQNCAICFHDASIYDQKKQSITKKLTRNLKGKIFTTKDILLENMIPTPTCVFKNILPHPLPSWFEDIFPFDWPLHLYISTHGFAYYLNENMAVYRVHEKGVTQSVDYEIQYQRIIKMLHTINTEMDLTKFHKYVMMSIGRWENDFADYYIRQGKLDDAWRQWCNSLRHTHTSFTRNRQLIVLMKLIKALINL